MFHGNKKKADHEKRPLTEEELKKTEIQLHKIKTIQKDILDSKNAKKYDEEKLDYILKVATLMPDFYTLWNYRKDIISNIQLNKSKEEFLSFLKMEIQKISKLQREHPKSYTMWYHR
jgi:geranylgeranyl transferase type-2 subunit alpha